MPVVKPEPVLLWEDLRGYRLSDRIWNVSEATAKQLDGLLETAINEGMSAVKLAKDLEAFLLPGRTYPRTNTPYGSDGSYNARRLARSEITLAHSRATIESAILNPFVERALYNLSGSHVPDAGDPCEDFADESAANNGYPVDECPVPVQDTHSHCMCYVTMATVSQEDAVAMIRDGLDADDQEAVDLFTDDGGLSILEAALLGLATDYFTQLFG